MGAALTKEALILDALSKQDVRKLRHCFSTGDHSPLHLLVPLSQTHLDRVHHPNQQLHPDNPTPYDKWLGMSPAHIAAEQPDIRVLREIVALVTPADEEILHLDDDEMLQLPDTNKWGVRDTKGLTPLSRAVRADNNPAVKLLLAAGADIHESNSSAEADKHDPTVWSHIRYCAANGMPEMLRLLLERGADNCTWGKDGRRSVHHAVEAGQLECVKMLIEHDKIEDFIPTDALVDREASQPETRIRAISKYIVRECSIPYPPEPILEAATAAASIVESVPDGDAATPDPQERHHDILGAVQMALQDAMRSLSFGPTHAPSGFRSNRDRGATLLHLACSHSHPHVLSYLLSLDEFRVDLEQMNDSGKSPIFMAIRHGSVECLKLLVDAGANVQSKDIESWTALHEAVKAGDNRTDILNYLIDDCKIDINAVDDDGWTALHVAARFSSTKAVDILIKAGCSIDGKTEDDETAVLLASAQASSAEVLRKLLANGANLSVHRDTLLTPIRLILSRKDFDQLCILLDHIMTLDEHARLKVIDLDSSSETGDTLLHICVLEDNLEATTKLLAVGAKPDEKNHEGIAPIHAASKGGNAAIAEALLEAKGDPDLVRGDGMMPLHIASDSGHAKVVEVLIKYGCDVNRILTHTDGKYRRFSPLMFAARLGNADIISHLIEAGANLNLRKDDGFTALHLAAVNGNTQACKNLIAGGADHMLEDETGYSPLQAATRHNQFDVVSTLLEANVAPDSCGRLGLTSLHIASFICDARLIWLLIRGGADVNAVNSDNATPLHIAAGREQGRVSMQVLLVNGAQMNVIDSEEDTPLHNACYRGLYQNVRLLLRRGAAPSPTNENNVTPLHLAAAVGSEETVGALLKYGADVEARDNDNKTPYRVASEQNHRKAMILLFRSMTISLQEIAPTATYGQATPTSSSDEVLCVICQNSLTGGEETRTLPCSHTYHNLCILVWLGGEDLTRHDSCPLCQKSVLPESASPPVP